LSTIKAFEELIVWQKSRKFVNNIYKLTKNFPREELYGLTSQMRRAAVSIMSNIAEGFDRRTTKEFISFLIIAPASVSEVQNDLYISLDLKYINTEKFQTNYDFAFFIIILCIFLRLEDWKTGTTGKLSNCSLSLS